MKVFYPLCKKLTIFLHPISTELREQPLDAVANGCVVVVVQGANDGHIHTHIHTQGCNRSIEAGLWVSATEALTIQISKDPQHSSFANKTLAKTLRGLTHT